ncbi:HAMP domain-containing histidine kinase [Ensifer sp. ENS06]|uniref:sensor histidine kinase n=1 Tax=Ensifer sp. ENS06 TaxID=2769276 RepID=UPI001784940F|nr:HAMP domain-containing sensor histidine kinase [Ensifer sp. ENS06]MBD9628183.1 HAMP domain-containing histidine kinase [Ensifer sp. ENS06]
MKLFARDSLRWKLVWQLLAFQAGIIVLLALVLTALIIRSDIGGMLADPQAIDVVSHAVERNQEGSLVLMTTPELAQLRAKAPGLWFILRSESGEILQDGPVPDIYSILSTHLDRISFVDIRDKASPYVLSAAGRTTESTAGTLDVMVGGVPLIEASFAVLFLSNLLLFLVLVLVALIAIIALPWIVGRAFKELSAVAGDAERINIDRRGARLAHAGVPLEVRPLVHAINDALERLDRGYERHRRFILDAAHELRTPISILQTRIEAMPTGTTQTRLFADAGRIAALAEQLLDLQRIDRNDETFSRVDLVALCERVAADLAPLSIASGYQLALDTDDRPVFVMGSAGALERCVINLVQNAIEHGGQRGDIIIRVGPGGVIEVSDDGPGVPLAEREQIFEPFYRLHPRERGAGLGLNLVKEVMSRHGGHVTVLDSLAAGACFRLTMPAC